MFFSLKSQVFPHHHVCIFYSSLPLLPFSSCLPFPSLSSFYPTSSSSFLSLPLPPLLPPSFHSTPLPATSPGPPPPPPCLHTQSLSLTRSCIILPALSCKLKPKQHHQWAEHGCGPCESQLWSWPLATESLCLLLFFSLLRCHVLVCLAVSFGFIDSCLGSYSSGE